MIQLTKPWCRPASYNVSWIGPFKIVSSMIMIENAHLFGFTLSYPREAFQLTGFYYEPWHYRYVGVELATSLHESGSSLTQFLLTQNPEPCIPDATS